MNNHPSIYGVLPVLQMPYRDDESIDYDLIAREIDFVIDAGADGVVLALGSEIMRLSQDERLELTKLIPRLVDSRCTVTISVGADTSRQAVDYAQAAEAAGADAVMALPPGFQALPEQRLFEYYKEIFDAVSIPLVIQNAGGFSGYSLSAGFQARLRRELGERVWFKPESQPVGLTLTLLQQALNNEGVVFDGNGGLYMIDSYRRGISGLMPACDLIRGTVAIWSALENGDFTRAYEVYFPLAALITLQAESLDIFLSSAKYLLYKQGIFRNYHIRRPAAHDLDTASREELDRLFEMLCAVL